VAYVFEGKGSFGNGESAEAVSLVEFTAGDEIKIRADESSPVRFMLMAGAPFREPIAPYGPFVMNTMEEIQQTLVDLRNGTFVQG
jgi:redox-sensitive bicupin YhaK (pirin superfamily)